MTINRAVKRLVALGGGLVINTAQIRIWKERYGNTWFLKVPQKYADIDIKVILQENSIRNEIIRQRVIGAIFGFAMALSFLIH